MASNGKLEALALLVAGGATVRSAAEQTGTCERTAYRLNTSPAFKRRVAEIRSEIAAATVGELTAAAKEAACTLRSLLDAANEPSIRLQASKAILASVGAISELGELRARLDALEQTSR